MTLTARADTSFLRVTVAVAVAEAVTVAVTVAVAEARHIRA